MSPSPSGKTVFNSVAIFQQWGEYRISFERVAEPDFKKGFLSVLRSDKYGGPLFF